MENLDQTTTVTSNVVPFPSNLPEEDRRALQAIERHIANPPDNSRVFWITGAMARYLLDKYNIANRPTKPTKIGEYSRSMAAKEWRLTGDTLKFSDRGILRDGQNRLLAGVASGTQFQTHIVFGVPDDFFSAMDKGKNRDGSDLLAIIGVPSAAIVAAAVRWAHLYDTGTVKLRTSIPAAEVLRLYQERYSGVSNFVPAARAVYKTHKWPAGFIAGSLHHLSKVDAKAADSFAQAMTNSQFSGKFLPLHGMVIALGVAASASSGRINDVFRAALMIKAWNVFRAGRTGKASDFKWDTTQPFPVAI